MLSRKIRAKLIRQYRNNIREREIDLSIINQDVWRLEKEIVEYRKALEEVKKQNDLNR